MRLVPRGRHRHIAATDCRRWIAPLTLPPAIAAFFAADRTGDADSLSSIFAPRARVSDHQAVHIGIAAIRAWWAAAWATRRHRAEPLDYRRDGDAVTVHARVTGLFPGSPAMRAYVFILSGSLIADLRII